MTAHRDRLRTAAAILPFFLPTAATDFNASMLRSPRDSWRHHHKIGGNGTPQSKARHAKNKSARKARRKNR